ncbi:hypothetical protein [Thermoflexus hugenholtzii]
MPKDKSTHSIHKFGVYLVTAELYRRGFVATPCARNIDIIATDKRGNNVYVKVKVMTQQSWQFHIDEFADIEFDGERQILKSPKDPPYPNLICLLVRRGEVYGKDEFFVLTWEEMRNIVYNKYRKEVIERRDGIRPKNRESRHFKIDPSDLPDECKDRWELFEKIGTSLHRE